jgi:hypothetical protein
MISTVQKGFTRLRALCASIALLVGTVSGPVWLVTQSSDTCGLACCVKEGSCCCLARRPGVDPTSHDLSVVVGAPLSTPCGKSCTTSILSAKLTRRSHLRAAGHHPFIYDRPGICCDDRLVISCEEVVTFQKAIESRGCPPRAPPPFLTTISA